MTPRRHARTPARPGRALEVRCVRVLYERARAEGAGSRQQVRAAARRFVRRHRRDVSTLRRVLRGVTASSALAVVLLGFGAEPASAQATVFAVASNPVLGGGLGLISRAAFGDLDGDGDLDLLVGDQLGFMSTYENVGTATSPTLFQIAFLPSGVGSLAPALGDLDGDGDLDLVVGTGLGTFDYYENTGSATSRAFVQRTGASNPLDGENLGSFPTPALGDIDGDGDLDLVAGEIYGTLAYYENTGSATSPVFVERTGTANPLDGEDAGGFSTPALGDLDGDGDLDLVAGNIYGTFVYYQNTGTATSPAFLEQSSANPLADLNTGSVSGPALGDLDGDGDLDLLSVNTFQGVFRYYENFAGGLAERTGLDNPLDGESVGIYSKPALADLDDDGDLDLVAGERYGAFRYYEHTGSNVFTERTGAANPLDGEDVGDHSSPALGDLDGDGDFDLVAGASGGAFRYYENTGAAASPVFVERTGAANPLDGEDVGLYSCPALGDVDGDGDLDLFAGEYGGTFVYYENTGSPTSPVFVERTGAANPLDGDDVGYHSTLALGDLDSDGDLDLVTGTLFGTLFYHLNTGNALSPAFVTQTGAADPLDGEDVGARSAPALGDVDGDGDVDLVSGESLGEFLFYENAVLEPAVLVVDQTGAANPLDGEDVGSFSRPAFGDLDADGDLDVVAGAYDGVLRYYENTGSATVPAFVEQTGTANPLDGLSAFSPTFCDLDGDGDLDLVAGVGNAFAYYENTGSATSAAFVEQTGTANPLDGESVTSGAPSLGDLDGDGDLDLVAGEYFGSFHYYENTGSATSPVFVERTGAANPLSVGFETLLSAPTLGDADGDGDLDVVAGGVAGSFSYYENTGNAISPIFIPRTGAANPFDAEAVGNISAPALGDLDADGDLDLVAGGYDGVLSTYYVPEPGRGLLLGAGLGLLQWLGRRRRRSHPTAVSLR